MLNVHCLHSATSNIAVFEAARRRLGDRRLMLKHRVRSDLLAAAEAAGAPTPEILERAAAELRLLARGGDAVLLTWSTLGEAVSRAAGDLPMPVLRVDDALAAAAVAAGGPVIVLCAAGSTTGPTRLLFEKLAVASGAAVEVRLVPGAWEAFRAGDTDRYFALVAEAADGAAAEAATVALAQASMAGALPLVRRQPPPLTSPDAGLAAALAAAEAHAASRVAQP
jgi:hypothetical protein